MKIKKAEELETKMVSYKVLKNIKTKECGERFIRLEPQSGALVAYYAKLKDMLPVLGKSIVVRKKIKNKLENVSGTINAFNNNWLLQVTYGYRSPEIQEKYFWYTLRKQTSQKGSAPNETDLYEEIHRSVAIPSIAGHPTGGAVDVTIINKSRTFIDLGSKLYDLADLNRYVFAPIPNNQKQARMVLRNSMISQGFAPFDGEWWHFSYGDKEWAAYYHKPFAIYDQINLETINTLFKSDKAAS